MRVGRADFCPLTRARLRAAQIVSALRQVARLAFENNDVPLPQCLQMDSVRCVTRGRRQLLPPARFHAASVAFRPARSRSADPP